MSPPALSLYRRLLREAQTLPAYNFRMYAVRRIRDAFKNNVALVHPDEITKQLEYAKQSLALIKRQAQIGQLYSTEKLVIEK